MQVQVCPRDGSKLASCSLDRSIKIWPVLGTSTTSNYTLGGGASGHVSGINCIDFFQGDKPLLASGADDFKVKIWDYNSKNCLVTL
jgi:coatomer subunit beta'